MSVINKMLQDLDKRQQPQGEQEAKEESARSEFVRPQLDYQQQSQTSKFKGARVSKPLVILLGLLIPTAAIGVYLLQSSSQSLPQTAPDTASQPALNKTSTVPQDLQPQADATEQDTSALAEPTEPVVVAASLSEKPLSENSVSEKSSADLVANESATAATEVSVTNANQASPDAEVAVKPEAIELASAEKPTEQDSKDIQVKEVAKSATENASKAIDDKPAETATVAKVKPAKDEIKPAQMVVKEVVLSKAQLAQREFAKAIDAEDNFNLERATNYYLEAIMIKPDYHEARKRLAAAHHQMQNTTRSIRVLERGVSMYPNELEFYVLMSNYLSANGEYDRALAKLDNIADNSMWARDKWIEQSAIAQQAKRPQLAEQAYRNLVRVEPNQGRWWMGLGYALDSQQSYAQAAQAYRSALDTNGLSNAAINYMENRLRELGDNL
ncbi:tetratricopeptide repeat protein [Shewanella sp. WXL01]|uniref:tetratricopeptide repeat protein n=1 Tax=Shewanella sp. WXL01 TaxID=2709721 RepID=UPI0014384143|nr:tetratricopeptide repeat protein [Shewanella sp. WXL01]NKF52342.1 tetratricopeptide repeat protein [Shewanella sp. WXL01]